MRVTCEIRHVTMENDHGVEVEAVEAVCTRCRHTTESFGDSDRSIKRCLVLMREGCPNRERNFYVG